MENKTADYPRRLREDISTAVLLAGFTFILLVVTAPQIGLVWDEPTYLVAAEKYPRWYGELITDPGLALSEGAINEYWEFNREHPPFSKVWSGFVWLGARHLFDDLTAHRAGNILLTSILVALLYLMVSRERSRAAGFVSAAALLTMPRFFFHAHLAALDVPVTVMIFAVTYIFWVSRDRRGFHWGLFLGIVWGLAIATKINALFIPPLILAIWTLIFQPRWYLLGRLALMGVVGVGTFILSWPWLYQNTFTRLRDFLNFFTVDRYSTEQFYFGNLYTPPHAPLPWHFPFVMVIIVVPFFLVLLSAVGAFSSIKNKKEREFCGLLILGALVSVLVLSSGRSGVYDNERLMMPAFPYLAALAGLGFIRIIPIIQQFAENRKIKLTKTQIISLVTAAAFIPHLLLSFDLYPHLLSYYSEVIGGAYGAKVLQLETTYWCESYSKTLDYLNEHAPPEAVVWAECHDVLIYYQLHGKLRSDLQIANNPNSNTVFSKDRLRYATFDEADYVVIQYRQSGFYRALREWIYARMPVFELKYRQLHLAEIYVQ